LIANISEVHKDIHKRKTALSTTIFHALNKKG